MQTIDRDGVTLAYEAAGSGEPAVLLVHGFGGARWHLAPQYDHFRASCRTVAVDRRGHGDSDAPVGAYTIQQAADDVAAVAAAADVERAVVVVESMDKIGFDLAARYPRLVAGLAIIDGPTYAGPQYQEAFRGFEGALGTPGYREAVRGFADRMVFVDDNDPVVRARATDGVASTPQHVLASSWHHFVGYDLDDTIGEVGCPVLVVDACFPKDLDRLRAACPQVEVVRVPGHGHLPQLFAPATVNAALEGFVARCSAPVTV